MGLGVFQHVRTMKRLCQLPKAKALISEHHLQGHSNPTGNENLNQKTVRVMTLAERKRRNCYMTNYASDTRTSVQDNPREE